MPRGTDGWMSLKEWIVRAEQTGHKKVTAAEKEAGAREKTGTEATEKGDLVGGVEQRRTDKSEKGCLLWQSPRPSVLPRSTSCSKADLRGTQTSWSAQENKASLCRLATPRKGNKAAAKLLQKQPPSQPTLGLHTVWAAAILVLEVNQRTPSKCPGGKNQSLRARKAGCKIDTWHRTVYKQG